MLVGHSAIFCNARGRAGTAALLLFVSCAHLSITTSRRPPPPSSQKHSRTARVMLLCLLCTWMLNAPLFERPEVTCGMLTLPCSFTTRVWRCYRFASCSFKAVFVLANEATVARVCCRASVQTGVRLGADDVAMVMSSCLMMCLHRGCWSAPPEHRLALCVCVCVRLHGSFKLPLLISAAWRITWSAAGRATSPKTASRLSSSSPSATAWRTSKSHHELWSSSKSQNKTKKKL